MAKKQVKKTEKKVAKKKVAKEVKGVSKDMVLGDIAAKFPDSVPVMFKQGLHCIGCGMVAFETLEQGCQAHGMSDKDIDNMVDEMNKAVEKAKNK
ncbi:MAG: DUF1858 domain-containing protein [Nanoarchaeota archaeon]|nr:DUF1858 domain-containing protein [Nanoarchaeota archaeon]MBU1321416.1 DUF1858 domain-containing protein [Nanoarchaeota archaeon]MBU1597042.1 DUF1858 domain-containing protein [Nanoarchaeota archaeon]MBU2440832.1 DUF1858 domain-containing protein [Nanoarchaeota archaeon]